MIKWGMLNEFGCSIRRFGCLLLDVLKNKGTESSEAVE